MSKISDINHDIRKCYGALSSFQTQLHHINGVVEEIHGTFQVLLGAFNDLESLMKEISNQLKK